MNLRHVHLQQPGSRHANPVCNSPDYKQSMLACVRYVFCERLLQNDGVITMAPTTFPEGQGMVRGYELVSLQESLAPVSISPSPEFPLQGSGARERGGGYYLPPCVHCRADGYMDTVVWKALSILSQGPAVVDRGDHGGGGSGRAETSVFTDVSDIVEVSLC